MNERPIKRGGPKPRAVAKRKRAAAQKKPSLATRLIAALPIAPATLSRIAGWSLVVLIGGLGVTAASYLGLPGMIGTELAEASGRAGFEVKRVEVTGIDRMDRLTVYAIALDQHSMAMPLVDLDKVRADLMKLGWIEDARVSRRLPDTLLVDIVERKPAAVWQNRQQLNLIDGTGVVLEPVRLEAMPDLPLVIGPDANRQTGRLNALVDAAPALRPMLAGATWIGNRRWDLRFQSGETLALPEGDAEAAKALVVFARLDGVERLLGRGFTRFDMRDPDKFVVRVPKGARKPALDATAKAEAAGKAGAAPASTGDVKKTDEKARKEREDTAVLKGDA